MADLTAALDRLNVRTAVEDAMNALKCPDKNSLQTQARVVARSLEAEFEGFKFQERGSLWSPHVRYVSDADVHLYGSRRAGISAAIVTRFMEQAKETSRVFVEGSLTDGDECVICLVSTPAVTFSPCGHQICCVSCYDT